MRGKSGCNVKIENAAIVAPFVTRTKFMHALTVARWNETKIRCGGVARDEVLIGVLLDADLSTVEAHWRFSHFAGFFQPGPFPV